MADTFTLEVLTPEVTLFDGPATALVMKTTIGAMTVLAGHAPFVGDVVPGEVKIERDSEPTLHLAVHGGFVQVDTSREAAGAADSAPPGPIPGLSTKVTVLAGVAELAGDIDAARAQQALTGAQERVNQLRGKGDSGDDGSAAAELAQAEAAVLRAQVRVQVAGSAAT